VTQKNQSQGSKQQTSRQILKMKSVKIRLVSLLPLRNRAVFLVFLLLSVHAICCLATNDTISSTAVKAEASSKIASVYPANDFEDMTIAKPVKCGDTICKTIDEVCCNESCGICAPVNGSCILTFCVKPAAAPLFHPNIRPVSRPRPRPRSRPRPRPRFKVPINIKPLRPILVVPKPFRPTIAMPKPPVKGPFCNVADDCPISFGSSIKPDKIGIIILCIKNECVVAHEKPAPLP
jgi:hypothetical protein